MSKMIKVAYNNCHGGFSLSPEAVKLAKKYAGEGTGWDKVSEEYGFLYDDVSRHDDVLIRVVEELGSEKASGQCAEIELWEVDEPYFIDEYDGLESVETRSSMENRFTNF